MIITFHQNKFLLVEFNSQSVEYLIIGGVAVKHYCPSRKIDDLDILINPTPENSILISRALENLNISLGFQITELTKSKKQVSLKQIHYADVVTPEEGFDFSKALAESEPEVVNDTPVQVISKEMLVQQKSTDRPKDKQDVRLLLRCA